jgi:hypothetical protein
MKTFKFKPVTIDGLKFKNVQYHRNGIAGNGFHCAVVHDPEVVKDFGDGEMLVTLFDIEGECCCAVYRLSQLPNINFGENSWRGDRYFYAMTEAVKAYEAQFDKHYGLTK